VRVEGSWLRVAGAAAGILALALVVSALTAGREAGPGATAVSTYNAAMPGARAFYELLCRTEPAAPVRLTSLDRLGELRGVLVIAEPLERPLGERDARRILAWVHAGNGLLYFLDPGATGRSRSALVERLAALPGGARARLAPGRFLRLQVAALRGEFPAFEPAPRILVVAPAEPSGGVRLRGTGLYVTDRPPATVVSWMPQGWGNIVVCVSSAPVQNQYVGEAGNLEFLLCALRVLRPAGGRVIFDELHHGHVGGRGLLALVSAEGVLAAVLQLAACGAVYVLVQGRRMGPPVRLPEAPAVSAAEHLRAAARLYREHCSPGEVAAAYAAFACRALARAREGGGWSASGDVRALLRRAREGAGSGMHAGEAAELVRELHARVVQAEVGKRGRAWRPARREGLHAAEGSADS